ncbi:helix-turn-helix domain-containing protein [Saccharibacillus kuerlensis]|uniref:HTH araC/xylS-type domain-containing protein n=1 Tax=Saccharibacillus kuerlensis TaxID=459527 RepID=A0ABQ2L3T5_9BACL|nr:helix-turn-helix domain-containing protein [Saccharibacillus kuerlensis]GGO01485.1 hypothetical protein GCM10010969_23840 [Saccharibacillus kuerlensis]
MIHGKRRTLFGRLLLSFAVLILMFTLCLGLVYQLFKNGLQSEIIDASRLEADSAAERFGGYFDQVGMMLFTLNEDPDVVGFGRQLRVQNPDTTDYLQARKAIEKLRWNAYNSFFYLEDAAVQFDASDLVLYKSGSASSAYFFDRKYRSDTYTSEFWKRQMEEPPGYTLYPAMQIETIEGIGDSKWLLPYRFSHGEGSRQTIALIDIASAAEAFYEQEGGRSLSILDRSGQLLYTSGGDGAAPNLPTFAEGETVALRSDTYYLKREGEDGLSYIASVPADHIGRQLRQMTELMTAAMAGSIAAALGAAYLLSRRLNRPVQRLLGRLLDRKPDIPYPDEGIAEYDLIGSKLSELMREKSEVRDKLNRHRSLLASFGYINELKRINTDIGEWEDFRSDASNYTVALHRINFRRSAVPPAEREEEIRRLKELIHLLTSERFEYAHTFQIEKDEIVSVLKEVDAERVMQLLRHIEEVIGGESERFLIVSAIAPASRSVSQFGDAYAFVRRLVDQAPLEEHMQILTESRLLPSSVSLSDAQEKELRSAIQEGASARCLQLIEQALDSLRRNGAGADQVRFFANGIAQKILHTAEAAHSDLPSFRALKKWAAELPECRTFDEYGESLKLLTESACALIRQSRSTDEEPVIALFFEILRKQYAEDLSLDYLSERLNLSGTYLSAYIKEKTGLNFSDHLTSVRMQKAKELLLSTRLNVSEISRSVGYSHITSFNRSFKKSTGLSPGEYRKQQMYRLSSG